MAIISTTPEMIQYASKEVRDHSIKNKASTYLPGLTAEQQTEWLCQAFNVLKTGCMHSTSEVVTSFITKNPELLQHTKECIQKDMLKKDKSLFGKLSDAQQLSWLENENANFLSYASRSVQESIARRVLPPSEL